MGAVTMSLPDAAARLTALTDHDRTLLVEAGAGSGKTALMAGRVAVMLTSGVAPREIVAITFTEAAASELNRIHLLYVDLGDARGWSSYLAVLMATHKAKSAFMEILKSRGLSTS